MQRFILNIIFLPFLFLISVVSARQQSALEKDLAADISDHRLDDFSLVNAAFILSGATEEDSLKYYEGWYNQLVETISRFNLDDFDRIGSAGKVFSYLHSTWLRKYKEKATTLIDVVREKRFNCVAGTILYNLVCNDLDMPTEAFETPTHTYTIFPNFTEQITVENTSPMGFNIMKNLREYSRYLLRFYPQKQALHVGLDRIYAYENSKGREINNTELLGLLAYNRAYFAVQKKDYETAYYFVRLAQSFNKDSRSNVNFEIGLYYRWGKKMFDEQRFSRAFQIFSDAYTRYWENKDFASNCKASFFNAQRKNWEKKDWENCNKLIAKMLDLDLLGDQELERLQQILQSWGKYFYHLKMRSQSENVLVFLNRIDPGNPQTQAFKKAVENLK